MHCAYHQTLCDLLRLGAPALYKLRGAFQFPPEQHEFLRYLQRELLRNAMDIATITSETSRHGVRMLSDTWLPTIIYDSSRIMLYHLTQLVDPGSEDIRIIVHEILPLVRQNIATLEMMQPLHAVCRTSGSRRSQKCSKRPILTQEHSMLPLQMRQRAKMTRTALQETPVSGGTRLRFKTL